MTYLSRCSLLCIEGDSSSNSGSQGIPAANLHTHTTHNTQPTVHPQSACNDRECPAPPFKQHACVLRKLPFCCPSAKCTRISAQKCNTDASFQASKSTHLVKTDCRPGPPTVMYSAFGVASSTTRRPPGRSSCSTLQMALQGAGTHSSRHTHTHRVSCALLQPNMSTHTQSQLEGCWSGAHKCRNTQRHAPHPPAQTQISAHYISRRKAAVL